MAAFSSQRKPGFFQELVDNVKQGFEKNKELKQSIKQFRDEAKKLEESQALKDARNKFVNDLNLKVYWKRHGLLYNKILFKKGLGDETDKSSKIIKDTLESFSEKVKEVRFCSLFGLKKKLWIKLGNGIWKNKKNGKYAAKFKKKYKIV